MKTSELDFKIPDYREMFHIKFISGRITYPPRNENFQMKQFAWLGAYISFTMSHHINLE